VLIQTVHGSLSECYVAEQIALRALGKLTYLPKTTKLREGHTECLRPDAIDRVTPLDAWLQAARSAIAGRRLPAIGHSCRANLKLARTITRGPGRDATRPRGALTRAAAVPSADGGPYRGSWLSADVPGRRVISQL
jgi:hypothetical protein